MARKNSENKRDKIATLLKKHGPLTARGIAEKWSKTYMRSRGKSTNRFRRNTPTVNTLSNLLRNKRFVVVGQVAGGTSLNSIKTKDATSGLVNIYGLRQDEEE